MIARQLTKELLDASSRFPVVALLGPRQSGKTTLVRTVFNKHHYVSLEDIDNRIIAQTDPRRFLQDFPSESGIILDEIQHAPELLSYIQTIVDSERKKGYFILTGSQNILVNQAVTQTLAGRIAILTLFPLSLYELKEASLLPSKIEDIVFQGSYPIVYSEDVSIAKTYANYIRSYVERDVREIKNITNLNLFRRFLQLCAGRTGQILNISSLASDLGVDHKTISSWISVLEASYVIFLLYPYHKNFGRRLIKSPKLYFSDTGIACSLLNIKTSKELIHHHMRGNLIETFIISDLLKQYYNLDQQPSLYFWRDSSGNEIDCIIEEAEYTIPIEIKASKTISPEFFKQFDYWKNIASKPSQQGLVIYGGSQNRSGPNAKVLSWESCGDLIQAFGVLTRHSV